MCRKSHVIDIGSRFAIIRHGHGTVPEAEMIHTVRTFSHCEEGFPVCTLHPDDQNISAVPFDGSGIECSMDAETFHQIRICLHVQVIPPRKRRMVSCQNGVFVPFINTIAFHRLVFPVYEGFMLSFQPLESFFKIHIFKKITLPNYSVLSPSFHSAQDNDTVLTSDSVSIPA